MQPVLLRNVSVPTVETNPVTQASVLLPTTAAHTVITVTASPTLVLPANPSRIWWIVHNDSGSVVYLKFGPGCSSDSFTHRLTAQSGYEPPLACYTGEITAARASGTSNLQVTEIVS